MGKTWSSWRWKIIRSKLDFYSNFLSKDSCQKIHWVNFYDMIVSPKENCYFPDKRICYITQYQKVADLLQLKQKLLVQKMITKAEWKKYQVNIQHYFFHFSKYLMSTTFWTYCHFFIPSTMNILCNIIIYQGELGNWAYDVLKVKMVLWTQVKCLFSWNGNCYIIFK